MTDKKKLFIVDDEKNLADTLAIILRISGYEVEVFYDAANVLHSIEQDPPDLILSDVVMPGMNGLELAILVRQQHPACKVLLFSGNANTIDLLRDVRSQGYEFEVLPKPMHPTDLIARIRAFSSEHAQPTQ